METQNTVQVLGWEDLLEEEKATIKVCLPWKSHGQRNLVGCSFMESQRVETT